MKPTLAAIPECESRERRGSLKAIILLSSGCYDRRQRMIRRFAVVGGGIIGLAVAHKLTRRVPEGQGRCCWKRSRGFAGIRAVTTAVLASSEEELPLFNDLHERGRVQAKSVAATEPEQMREIGSRVGGIAAVHVPKISSPCWLAGGTAENGQRDESDDANRVSLSAAESNSRCVHRITLIGLLQLRRTTQSLISNS